MNRLRVLLAMAAALGGTGAVGRAQAVSAPPPPARFERVLWCADAARGLELADRLGFTAVQLSRGGDPAPVRAAGLGFYLDQPIGKGLLERRDEQWRPIQQAYEKARDVATLVLPGCPGTPGCVTAAVAAAVAEVQRVRGPGLLFVALADEPSATRHDAPLDTCRCEHCLRAFREFVVRRQPELGPINAALGSSFAALADVVPPTTDQIRRRELGDAALPKDLRGFALWLDFVDEQYARTLQAIAGAVGAVVPETPVGVTGTSAPAAFGGNDPSRWMPGLTLLEPYAIGGAPELVRSFAPRSAHRYATLVPPDAKALGGVPLASWVRAQVAAMACAGLAGAVVWNDGTIADGAGELTPFGDAVQAALRALQPALDALAGAEVVPGPVWVLESQASVRAWWMLDSAGDGLTWVRRLQSYEATHSTSQAARLGWARLLQDLGCQPHFVAETALPERLLRERPRCLVLPAAIALGDRTVQAIATWVQNGGVLIADHSPGLYDAGLLRRASGALDGLFGVAARSLAFDDLLVREGRSTAKERGLPLAERGLRGQLGEHRDAGDVHLERQLGKGRAVYLNAPVAAYGSWRLAQDRVEAARDLRRRVRAVLAAAGVEPPCEVRGTGLPTCIERVPLRTRDGRFVLAIRVNALDSPAVLKTLAADGPRQLRLELPAAARLRLLDGAVVGEGTGFDVQLDAFGALFLEVSR